MDKEYYIIKDNCRKGLLKYLSKAISKIPTIEKPLLLDVGCGSGVPTLFLAENFDGNIIAVDPDTESINRLEKKIEENNLSTRITIIKESLFKTSLKDYQFDLILAEGFLNTVGFEKGFLKLIGLLKQNGYLIIHDDYQNQNKNIKLIEKNNCRILDMFRLDELIWWNDYYNCLEKEIASIKNKKLLGLFKPELHEIELYKQDSSQFNSVYYVIENVN